MHMWRQGLRHVLIMRDKISEDQCSRCGTETGHGTRVELAEVAAQHWNLDSRAKSTIVKCRDFANISLATVGV